MQKIRTTFLDGTARISRVELWAIYCRSDKGAVPELILHYPDGHAEAIPLSQIDRIEPELA